VAALIDHLDEGPAVLVGTSGGAVVALHTAIQMPARVRAVVADSCVARQPPEMLEAEVAKRAQAGRELAGFWAYAHGEDWQAVIDADNALMQRHAARDGRWFGEELSEVRCPVLFSGSMQDATLHEGAAQMLEMARVIPESEVSLVNGGDHPLMWTRPQAFRGLATSFLDRLSSGT
jgi:pimeloyl-ACP methyl ester carboxylesterase